jgi:hypothetical protein
MRRGDLADLTAFVTQGQEETADPVLDRGLCRTGTSVGIKLGGPE